MLSDIFPTGFHRVVSSGAGVGSTVHVAGAGPVGLAAVASAQLLGATVVIVSDLNAERLAQAGSFGCETVDVSQGGVEEQIERILEDPEVDAAVDAVHAVGFEARDHGPDAPVAPATVLNLLMGLTRAGRCSRHPRLYVTDDPGGTDDDARSGTLHERVHIARAVDATVIRIKHVLNPHGR
ncbi:zinc-binding dehydrogenase [Streptomyces sp. R28]|uniref:Zinc-binding dehydrogenase n=1 Tax=Streptomyces sp. R28 TaxID=3238628 RepID=A0AB39PTW2_9ACTN